MTSQRRQPALLTPQRRLLLMGVLLVFAGVYVVVDKQTSKDRAQHPVGVPLSSLSPKVSPSGGRGATLGAPPAVRLPDAPQEAATTGPVSVSPPASLPVPKARPELLADGKVRTVMASGETLVTGGHLNAEGRWEFVLVKASLLENSYGKQLGIHSSVVALDDAAVGRAGLSNLLSGAVETRQHGEVWSSGEAERILKGMEGQKGADTLSSPSLVLPAGSEGTVEIGSSLGIQFRLEVKGQVLDGGGLDLSVSHQRIAPVK